MSISNPAVRDTVGQRGKQKTEGNQDTALGVPLLCLLPGPAFFWHLLHNQILLLKLMKRLYKGESLGYPAASDALPLQMYGVLMPLSEIDTIEPPLRRDP